MWTYRQHDGELTHGGEFVGTGYSGKGNCRNSPSSQNIEGYGPIPQGIYRIGQAYDDPHLGPCVMHLDPQPGTNTYGRSLFRVHGDDARHDASHGCIILGPSLRLIIATSADRDLTVVA